MLKPDELQAIRERLNAEMRMTQIGRREMWQLAFEDVPRLLDEIERLRGELEKYLRWFDDFSLDDSKLLRWIEESARHALDGGVT